MTDPIPLLASLFALQPETAESGVIYTHMVRLPEPKGVRFDSLNFDVCDGRMTVTGTVRVKNRRAFLRRLCVVTRRSRGMRRHVRLTKARQRREKGPKR